MIDISAFIKKNGLIWGPEPEIYEGIAGFYTYGPLGKLLKNKVENQIRKTFSRYDFWEVETPLISPAVVWEASGHIGSFTDPLIKDEKGGLHRVDNLIEEQLLKDGKNPDEFNIGNMSNKDLLKFIKDNKILAPNGRQLKEKIVDHNLMMETTVSTDTKAFNRPETATVTYLPFKNYHEYFRKKMPFGVYQIGKAFRNEISPRNNVLRGREFTQAEGQIFLHEDQKKEMKLSKEILETEIPLWSYKMQDKKINWNKITIKSALKKGLIKSRGYAYALALSYEFVKSLNFPKDRIRYRQHNPNELAFYAEDAWDLEVRTNLHAWVELAGVHDRKNYDLTQHQNKSKTSLKVDGEIPHILEIALGTDRITYALIDIFAKEEKINKDTRVVWKLPGHLSPIRFAIFPLQKKDGLSEKAKKIYNSLSEKYQCVYDESGSIGKRYRRQDERGTPHCITVDYQTLEDETVTLSRQGSSTDLNVSVPFNAFPNFHNHQNYL